MPNQGRKGFNVSPSVTAAARASQGIPQGGAVPAPAGIDIGALLAALGGGKLDIASLMQLLALLSGAGQVPGGMMQQEVSPVEEAFMGGGYAE